MLSGLICITNITTAKADSFFFFWYKGAEINQLNMS